jgi:hypothetical protein
VSAESVVGIVLGAWGAIVSTVLAVRAFRRDRRRVTVVCETRWARVREPPGMGKFSVSVGADELFLRVRVLNTGQRPVEPRQVRFLDGAGRQVPVAGD